MTSACPLCGSDRHMHKSKLLYGSPVCRKCFYKFANRRQLAYLVDWILYQGAMFAVGLALGAAMVALNATSKQIDLVSYALAWSLFPLLFFCKDGFAGHSPGKALCGVKVVHRETNEPIGFLASLKRNLVLYIPVVPLVVAFLLQKGYRWGDGWAKTKVIWKKFANNPVFTGAAACQQCGYDLRASLTGVCPECGSTVPMKFAAA